MEDVVRHLNVASSPLSVAALKSGLSLTHIDPTGSNDKVAQLGANAEGVKDNRTLEVQDID